MVTASKVPQSESYTPSFVTVLSREEIRLSNALTLADVLGPSPGIFIKDYGGASALKTISQRGLGSEHTLVLLNGLRVSSMQNGLMDLGLLPVDEIEAVEILRGGQSALYGADAVAGLVNIVTRPGTIHNNVAASISLGSFGSRRYDLTGSLNTGQDVLRFGFGEDRSEGDYPFDLRNGPTVFKLRRQNSDVAARFGNICWVTGSAKATRLTVEASGMSSERGVGGVVVSPFSSSAARQTDRDQVLQVSLSTFASEHATFHLSAQLHAAYERYRDPNLNIDGEILDNYFQNLDLRMEPRIDLAFDNDMRLGLGTELVRTTSRGNSMSTDVTRQQWGTYLAAELRPVKPTGIIDDVAVFPAVRFDVISSITPTWSPQMGGLVRFSELDIGPIRRVAPTIRFAASRNFRMPTFNELYFHGGGGLGNSSLRPELSTSAEAGASVNFLLAGEHVIQGTSFINDMTDRIVWLPAGSGTVSPRNLRHVRSQGVELLHRWDWPGKILSLEENYSTSDSRKLSADFPGDPTQNTELVYVPHESFTSSIVAMFNLPGAVVRQLGGMLSYAYVGYRYCTEDNSTFLPGYGLVNLGIRSRLSIGGGAFLVKVDINNLLGKEYQVILGYPMPMRSYRMTLGVEY